MLKGPGGIQNRISLKKLICLSSGQFIYPPYPLPLASASAVCTSKQVLLYVTASVKFLRFCLFAIFAVLFSIPKTKIREEICLENVFFNPCSQSNHGTKSNSKMNTMSWSTCINYSFEWLKLKVKTLIGSPGISKYDKLYIRMLCHSYFGCFLHSNKHKTVVTVCNSL